MEATAGAHVTERVRTWLDTWGRVLPLLLAEGTIWLGFGALLPILPIYFTRHGVDLPTLGVVVAAWPAARLVGEPIFGWLADRVSRKALMVTGLALAAACAVLPLFAVGPAAFIGARLLAGACASIYDPAARGYLVDANPPQRRGEAFGLYGAAQMGGFMVGPAIGGIAASITGDPGVVFWVAAIALVLSALLVATRVPDLARGVHDTADSALEAEADVRPPRIANRLLAAAIIFSVGSYFAGGTYEVVWSLYLTSLGANLTIVSLSFFTFALPVMLLSPVTGRFTDRQGGFIALTLGMAGIAACGALYTLVPVVWFVVVLGLVEGTAFAFSSPALYLLISRAAPPGRSSTVQGITGAAGTIGTIVASLLAGAIANVDLRAPFLACAVATVVALAIGLVVGRRPLWHALQPHARAPALAGAASAGGTGG
jgi:MFS family permease